MAFRPGDKPCANLPSRITLPPNWYLKNWWLQLMLFDEQSIDGENHLSVHQVESQSWNSDHSFVMIFLVLNCVLGCPICCSTPQINTWTSDWVEFFAEHRLGYQLKLALEQFGDSSIYEKGNPVLVIGVHQLNIIPCFMKDASWHSWCTNSYLTNPRFQMQCM